MARVALVSHDVQTVQGRTGGVGTFVTRLATLFRESGDEVTIILARAETEPRHVDEVWKERYRSWGIQLIERHNTLPRADRWSDAWPLRLSERIAPLLEGFDIAYFADWANVGFLPVREKRFRGGRSPVLVTVLHGPSNWVRIENRQYPKVPEDQHVDFIERYTACHSDAVIAPSRFLLDWLKGQGWRFRNEPEVLGIPYRPESAPLATEAVPVITRVAFFGRLEVRKGFRLFVRALLQLAAESTVLGQLQEIVLLGPEHEQAVADRTRRELDAIGIPVSHIPDLDSVGVHEYLTQHASDALVICASPVENLPATVVEASCISGLNLICSRGGGTPEVFGGRGDAQLFDPDPASLAAKIEDRLKAPLHPDELVRYDYEGANRRWLEFHRRLCEGRHTASAEKMVQPPVDVCITYFNKQLHFPGLLEALERQTAREFGVIAVDDGSTKPEARTTFDSLSEQYKSRGWIFFRQPNAWVDAARNRAAQKSSADYLLFIDADDLPAPNAIERLMEAATLSGCDCLSTYGCLFEGDGLPFDLSTGQVTAHIRARHSPLGPDLVTGLVDPMVFGPPMILIRRKVFEEVGGYREIRGAGHEDWELQVRLLVGHYETDVLPEYLLFFRRLEDGGSSTDDEFTAKRRVLEAYEAHLTKSGFSGGATALFALQRRCQELESIIRQNVPIDVRLRLHDRLRTLLNRPPR